MREMHQSLQVQCVNNHLTANRMSNIFDGRGRKPVLSATGIFSESAFDDRIATTTALTIFLPQRMRGFTMLFAVIRN